MKKIPQFVIAAPHSGSGKTTLARGLMALLARQGFNVQPFKCGPDYIDTKFHTAVCNRPSINLDSFMASPQHICQLYAHYAKDADVCMIEGMMGLFDGYERDKGSSAEIAQILSLPIVLIVDAKAAAYSMAALLSGFIHFRNDVHILGVIFNNVGSSNHFQRLQQVCDDLKVTCFGYLSKQKDLEISSRYLGLDFSQSSEIDLLVNLIKEHIDWQLLLSSTLQTPPAPITLFHPQRRMRMMVAHNDESFSFLYQEHIDLLNELGEVFYFNPEENIPLSGDIDLIYLPGGYPEKHLSQLSAATRLRQSIAHYAAKGVKIIAECGGMMYLCKEIINDKAAYPMCNVLPYSITARKSDKKLSLGYRTMHIGDKNYRGHEFHYTQFSHSIPPTSIPVYNAKEERVSTPVFIHNNILASYTHLYWGEKGLPL